jgi:hypothetical protein
MHPTTAGMATIRMARMLTAHGVLLEVGIGTLTMRALMDRESHLCRRTGCHEVKLADLLA